MKHFVFDIGLSSTANVISLWGLEHGLGFFAELSWKIIKTNEIAKKLVFKLTVDFVHLKKHPGCHNLL